MEGNIYKKLSIIQSTISVAKNQKNTFGNYNYRSCEDILQALQTYCKELGVVVLLTDDIKELLNGWVIVEATASLVDVDTKESISVKAQAGIQERKGMDLSQTFGASSSYARKYALNGLFKLDDNKDADTDAFTKLVKKEEKSETRQEVEKMVGTLVPPKKNQKKTDGFTDAKDLPFPEIVKVEEEPKEMDNYEALCELQNIVAEKCEQVGKKPMDCYAYYCKKFKENDLFKFTTEQYQEIIDQLDKAIEKKGM